MYGSFPKHIFFISLSYIIILNDRYEYLLNKRKVFSKRENAAPPNGGGAAFFIY